MNYSNLNEYLGSRIKECRNNLKITQEQLAETIGISQSYLGQIERGVRGINIENLTKIANALNTSLDFLLSDYLIQNKNDLDIKWSNIINGKTYDDKEIYIALVQDLEKYIAINNQKIK